MKKSIFFATIAVAVVLAGCNKNNDTQESAVNPDEIRVETVLPTRATQTTFEAGDRMGLFAVEYDGDTVAPLQIAGNYINNEPMTYDGTEWHAPRTLYWSTKACDFYGIYPYIQLGAVDDVLFDIVADQNSARTADALGGYEASDLLWAKAEHAEKADGAVHLQFRHMMSRLVVKVAKGPKFEGKIPDDITAHIYNTATTAKVNYVKGSLEKYIFSDNRTITMRKVDNETFDAIVVPQFIERSTPLVEITMGGIAYLLEYSMTFRPGYCHTLTLTLNTSPDQEKIEIAIDGEIENW